MFVIAVSILLCCIVPVKQILARIYTMKKRLVIQAEEEIEAEVIALAKAEQRTLSAMGNILLKEALAKRKVTA